MTTFNNDLKPVVAPSLSFQRLADLIKSRPDMMDMVDLKAPVKESINNLTPEQLDGITKARLSESIVKVNAGGEAYPDDVAYATFVCTGIGLTEFPAYAADSYAEQYADKTIAGLEEELAAAQEAQTSNPAPEPQ